jgi:hypothetical protein
MKNTKLALAPVLLLLAACGGGGSGAGPVAPAPATTLSYTNPPLAGYSLQVVPASNHTRQLTLNLVGPTGQMAQGVSIFLTADPALVTWAKTAGAYAVPGTVFTLGPAPQAFVTSVSAAGGLQVGLYQKTGSVTYGSAPLLSLGLNLLAGSVKAGSTVALSVSSGTQAVYVDVNGAVQPLAAPVAVGTLVAN